MGVPTTTMLHAVVTMAIAGFSGGDGACPSEMLFATNLFGG